MFYWLSLVFFLSVDVYAHQPVAGKVMASGGLYLYQTDLGRTYDNVSQPKFLSAGITLSGDLDSNGGVEVGMFFLQKHFYRKADPYAIVEKVKRIYITTGYRHWFNSSFSAGLAIFSSYAMGDPQEIHNSFPGGNAPSTSADDAADFGLDFSFQWEFYTWKEFLLLSDIRYSKSFTDRKNEDADHRALYLAIKREVNL